MSATSLFTASWKVDSSHSFPYILPNQSRKKALSLKKEKRQKKALEFSKHIKHQSLALHLNATHFHFNPISYSFTHEKSFIINKDPSKIKVE